MAHASLMSADEKVVQNWTDPAPGWVLVLASACDATSQNRVAKRIGYSPAVVGAVLTNSYPGRLDKVEAAVRGALLNVTVTCPVLGEINADRCVSEQRRPLRPTNPNAVRLYHACRNGCPHSYHGS